MIIQGLNVQVSNNNIAGFLLYLSYFLLTLQVDRDFSVIRMMQTFGAVWRFYRDGFRSMTWGRVLWVIILLKLFVLFFVLRLFFFPDFLSDAASEEGEEGYVSRELIERAGR